MAQISASPNPGPESRATLAGPVCLLPCAGCGVVARLRDSEAFRTLIQALSSSQDPGLPLGSPAHPRLTGWNPSGPVTLTAPGGGQTARQGPQRTSGC